MKIYTLSGVSKRGKQIIKQHGERWECINSLDAVLFSQEKGPWLFIEPIGALRIANTVKESKEEPSSRWVHSLFDKDFKVMP